MPSASPLFYRKARELLPKTQRSRRSVFLRLVREFQPAPADHVFKDRWWDDVELGAANSQLVNYYDQARSVAVMLVEDGRLPKQLLLRPCRSVHNDTVVAGRLSG